MANTTKTPTTVKNEVRAETFQNMVTMFSETYGNDKVFIIGDSEIAVQVSTAPTGEPVFATFSPTVKDYCDRTTKTKTVKAFDVTAEVAKFSATLNKRAETAKKNAENKAAKIAKDKAAREKRAAERAEAKAKAANVKV